MWGRQSDIPLAGCGGQGSRCRILERQVVSDASELESGPSQWVVEHQKRIPGGRSGISHFLLGHFF
jgi:hypothetical protein